MPLADRHFHFARRLRRSQCGTVVVPEDCLGPADIFDEAEFEETRPFVVGAINSDLSLVIKNPGRIRGKSVITQPRSQDESQDQGREATGRNQER